MPQQTWRCPRCDAEYVSPIRICEITCKKRHAAVLMELVAGALPKQSPPKKAAQSVHSPKPKASRATLDRVMSTMKQVGGSNG